MHEIPELDARGLRTFALTTGAILAGLFGLVLPWLLGRPLPIWPWPLAAVLMIWGMLAPRSLGPVYRGWMRFGLLMNRVTSPVVLTLVFFLVFVPAGLVIRLLGKDPMKRRLDPETASYREPSHPAAPESMEKPY